MIKIKGMLLCSSPFRRLYFWQLRKEYEYTQLTFILKSSKTTLLELQLADSLMKLVNMTELKTFYYDRYSKWIASL